MAKDASNLLENPNVRQFLDFLGKAEGADYNVIVGGRRFDDYSAHPGVVGLRTRYGPSTAAGKYQITKTTYNDIAPKLGITDFSPASQDRIAVELLRRRGALDQVAQGNFDEAINRLGNEWASLPSSRKTQPKRSWEWVKKNLGEPTQVAQAPTPSEPVSLMTMAQAPRTANQESRTVSATKVAQAPKMAFADLPANYRAALAANYLADTSREDAVSAAQAAAAQVEEPITDGGGGRNPYLEGFSRTKVQDPYKPLQAGRQEEPQGRSALARRILPRMPSTQPSLRMMATGGEVVAKAANLQKAVLSQKDRDWIAAREKEYGSYIPEVDKYNAALADYQKQVDLYKQNLTPQQKLEYDAYEQGIKDYSAKVDQYGKLLQSYVVDQQGNLVVARAPSQFRPYYTLPDQISGINESRLPVNLDESAWYYENPSRIFRYGEVPEKYEFVPTGAEQGYFRFKGVTDPFESFTQRTVPGEFTLKPPGTPPPEFTMQAPTVPAGMPYTPDQIQQYQAEAQARAQRAAQNRATALQVFTGQGPYSNFGLSFGGSGAGNVNLFAEGGEVRGDKEIAKLREIVQRLDKSYFRIEGGGAGDKNYTGFGGRATYGMPLGKNLQGEVYLEGYGVKPRGMPYQGEITGGGLRLTKQFKDGGDVSNEVPRVDAQGRVIREAPTPERRFSVGERVLGAGEAALSAASGLTAPASILYDVARGKSREEISPGNFMYAPRTEAGQEMAQDLGRFMQESKLDAALPQVQLQRPYPASMAAKQGIAGLRRGAEELQLPGVVSTPPVGALNPKPRVDTSLLLPQENKPFIGEVERIVADLPGPVTKEQFLGMMRKQGRKYEIGRVEQALEALPEGAKIEPVELFQRLQATSPNRFTTEIVPPGARYLYDTMDNPFPSEKPGAVNLLLDLPPEQKQFADIAERSERLVGDLSRFNLLRPVIDMQRMPETDFSTNPRNTMAQKIEPLIPAVQELGDITGKDVTRIDAEYC
jgi:muramidase (phage lysozyme)